MDGGVKAHEMIARIDWTTDDPRAWIKNNEWVEVINRNIGKEMAELMSVVATGRGRIDKLLPLLQLAIVGDGDTTSSVLHTALCLKEVILRWLRGACNQYDTLWWEVAPMCHSGNVRVKIKSASNGDFFVDPDGTFVEGRLGVWLVDDKGRGSTSVNGIGVLFDVACLVEHDGLIIFR